MQSNTRVVLYDNNILVDWAFSCQETVKQTVETSYPNEIHRWPPLRHVRSRGGIYGKISYRCIMQRRDRLRLYGFG